MRIFWGAAKAMSSDIHRSIAVMPHRNGYDLLNEPNGNGALVYRFLEATAFLTTDLYLLHTRIALEPVFFP